LRRTLTTIDAHAAGEPLRIVTSGIPPLRGVTILERRREMLEQHDHLRRVLMYEPRGHADMYGAVLTPPVTPEADYGVLFMHNEGYSTMCGHGIIALTTALIETGQFPAEGDAASIGYDTPAGFVRARARVEDGRVREVAFENVPSFVYAGAVEVKIHSLRYSVPVVFGGAFYAIAPSGMWGLNVQPDQIRELIDLGMAVKHAVEAEIDVVHPLEPELRDIYGTIITGDPLEEGEQRNVTIFADGEVDRSPCGTGTAGRLAWLYANGELALNEPYRHESIIGTVFAGRVLRETRVGDYAAVVPEIAGQAFLTGYHTFIVEPDDPLNTGFLVR
jgi:proline racemase